jgi:hypothetical protein
VRENCNEANEHSHVSFLINKKYQSKVSSKEKEEKINKKKPKIAWSPFRNTWGDQNPRTKNPNPETKNK